MTSVPLTLIILTTVVAWVLLLVAAAAGLLVALYLARQAQKVQGIEEVERKYASVAADLSVLKKGVNALEELVAVKLNRMATSDKRARKQKQEQEEEDPQNPEFNFPADLEFPSRMKHGTGSDRVR